VIEMAEEKEYDKLKEDNDFGKSGNIQLSEKHFKLLKKWFKRKR